MGVTRDRWPPLPEQLPGVGGMIRVIRPRPRQPGLAKDELACWTAHDRTIWIRRSLRRDIAWVALLHEWTHAALDDCGVSIAEAQEEGVCQAVAAAGRLLVAQLAVRA